VFPSGGGITVLIHIVREAESIRTALSLLARRGRVGLTYYPAAQSLAVERSAPRTGWHDGRFVTAYRPKPRVFFSGGPIEVEAAARLAEACGYSVCLDHEKGSASPSEASTEIDPDTAVVILHHDLNREIPVLEAALAAKPFYIGALGSSSTHARRMLALQRLGYTPSDIARIKAPIGIFAKARDATSLALSVLADIAAARTAST
jgi:xanthine dehydrogenase accessory factor